MKTRMPLMHNLGILALLTVFITGSASAETALGKTMLEKLAVEISKLGKACAKDIRTYCKTVTPGEGRIVYCMQAHEDKITPRCAYQLEETASVVQTSADSLKDAVIACNAELTGVCSKIVPGEGRIAACLISNKSTASKECQEAIRKVEALSAQ
jgi:hypothetical protein